MLSWANSRKVTPSAAWLLSTALVHGLISAVNAVGQNLLSRRFKPVELIVGALVIAAVTAAPMCWRAWQRRVEHRRWTTSIERLGALVVTAGYEDTSRGIGRVPILGEVVTHRSQVELFVDDPETFDAVLQRAAENPELKRVWLDLTKFDRSMQNRIRQEVPGVDIVCYTPAAGFTTPAPTQAAN